MEDGSEKSWTVKFSERKKPGTDGPPIRFSYKDIFAEDGSVDPHKWQNMLHYATFEDQKAIHVELAKRALTEVEALIELRATHGEGPAQLAYVIKSMEMPEGLAIPREKREEIFDQHLENLKFILHDEIEGTALKWSSSHHRSSIRLQDPDYNDLHNEPWRKFDDTEAWLRELEKQEATAISPLLEVMDLIDELTNTMSPPERTPPSSPRRHSKTA